MFISNAGFFWEMCMKRLVLTAALSVSLCMTANVSSGLELLSNQSLDEISARAVSVETQIDNNPLFIDDMFADPPKPELTSFSQDNTGPFKTVFVEFLGVDTVDDFGYAYHENFYANFSAGKVVYENLFSGQETAYGDFRDDYTQNMYSFVFFEGSMKGTVAISEYFDNDPELTSKPLTISKSRIDLPGGLEGDILCSYQGQIYAYDDIPEIDTSFDIYPNIQTITTGQAENGDLAILLPEGFGENTLWRPVVKSSNLETGIVEEYLVIPEGDRFVHITLCKSIAKMKLKYTISLAGSKKTYLENKSVLENENGRLPGQKTLGTLAVSVGPTTISAGNLFITINDTL